MQQQRGFGSRWEEELIYASRWLLYPLNLGLILIIIVYDINYFFAEILHLLFSKHLEEVAFLSTLIGLLDKVMVTSLIISVVIGGHQIYIGKFKLHKDRRTPLWLDHIDTVLLKVKVLLNFVGVSSAWLLKDFLNIGIVPPRELYLHIVLHFVFLISALITTIIWRLTHPFETLRPTTPFSPPLSASSSPMAVRTPPSRPE